LSNGALKSIESKNLLKARARVLKVTIENIRSSYKKS
jgi:hypothetical protein